LFTAGERSRKREQKKAPRRNEGRTICISLAMN
jgi:hypothetical protein